MNKLVNWGHWVVGALLTFVGLWSLAGYLAAIAPGFWTALRGGPVSIYPDYLGVAWSAMALVCAWGILKWRLWGHYLALFFIAFNLAIAAYVFDVTWHWDIGTDIRFNCTVALALLMGVWLLLPAVQRSLAI